MILGIGEWNYRFNFEPKFGIVKRINIHTIYSISSKAVLSPEGVVMLPQKGDGCRGFNPELLNRNEDGPVAGTGLRNEYGR